MRALHTLGVKVAEGGPLLAEHLADEKSWTVRYAALRYLRLAEGMLSVGDRAMLSSWTGDGHAPAKDGGLALDGSYQRTFQAFLTKMAVGKIQLPVFQQSKWDGVIAKHEPDTQPAAIAARVKAVVDLVPHADSTEGAPLAKGLCLTCHSLGNQGVGFAPPLDGSEARDLEGLITACLLYTSPSPRDQRGSRMPSSA